MKHFYEYFKLSNLFSPTPVPDITYLSEMAKNWSRVGSPGMVKLFLENYAIAMTEREVMMHLRNGGAIPTYLAQKEIKKLIDIIDLIEKKIGQDGKKTIG